MQWLNPGRGFRVPFGEVQILDEKSLNVRMLGEFSIQLEKQTIGDSDNRSRKVWLLLACMIYFRKRTIPQEELMSLLWGDEESSSNPGNALKTMFHRVRSTLDQLGEHIGHTLIVRSEGSYAWNTDYPITLDADQFETLCKAGSAAEDDETRLRCFMQALDLYRGDFLPKLSTEAWVVSLNAYFHNLYIQTVRETANLLERSGRLEETVRLCRQATVIEPYDEALYLHLMRALLAGGNQKAVMDVYQNMSSLMFDNFGVMPSDEIKAVYRQAARSVNEREVSLSLLQDRLKEPESGGGALLCDYDFFKVIYHAEARAVARSGDAVHIGMLTAGAENGELARRSLDTCMENPQNIVCSNLRRGDVASRCSLSQFIILLPQANYENACMVMGRIIKAFVRQYPHSPASLRYSVQPLEPNA